MAATRRAYTGAAVSTTTASSIAASGTTSFTVTAYTGWPYGTDPFYVVVEPGTASEEKILVTRTGSTDTTINVASDSERGQDGTSAVSHSTGSTVFPVFTAVDADEANAVASVITADTTNGRIGIGTATPSQELDVNGDIVVSAGNGIMFDRSGSDSHILYKETPVSSTYGTPDDVVLRNPNSADILFQTSGSTRAVIDSSGKVGIGTATPGYPLEVEDGTLAALSLNDSGGTVGASVNSRVIFEAGGSAAGQIGFLNTGSGVMSLTNEDGRVDVTVVSNDPILFKTNDTERMRVDDNGRIGINDTTPSYTLDVNGDINATGDLRVGGTAIGAWTSYTPTLTNFTGTVDFAVYAVVNKIVIVHASIDLTSTVTGTLEISAPVNFSTLGGFGAGQVAIGWAHGIDVSLSNGRYSMFVQARGTNVFRFVDTVVDSFSNQLANATQPFTWASGDSIRFTATYKGA